MAMDRGLAKVALHWFERAFDLRKHIETASAFEVMGVVYLVAKATLMDWQGMESHVPRVRNLPFRRGLPEGIVRELGLLCLGIAKNPERRTERLQAFLKVLEEDAALPVEKFEFGYFSLKKWIVGQLDNSNQLI